MAYDYPICFIDLMYFAPVTSNYINCYLLSSDTDNYVCECHGSCSNMYNKYENCFKKMCIFHWDSTQLPAILEKCIMEGYTTNAYQCIIKTTT